MTDVQLDAAALRSAPVNEHNPIVDFIQSAAYSSIEAPLRAVVQVADKSFGTDSDKVLTSGLALAGIAQPTPATFGTTAWHAQQLGGAVGMMVPFMLMRGGVRAVGAMALTEGAVAAPIAGMDFVGKTLAIAGKESAVSAATGLAYGTLLQPVDNPSGIFVMDKFKNGLSDSATFGAMGFFNPLLGRAFGTVAATAEKSALLPEVLRAPAATILRGPVLPGIVSGVPGGVVSAEVSAWQQGRHAATLSQIGESAYGMAFVGGALGSSQWLGAQRAGTDSTNARYLSDRAGLTSRTPVDVLRSSYKVIAGQPALSRLYDQLAGHGGDAEVNLTVQQSLRGFWSGLLGQRLAPMGGMQSMFVAHRTGGIIDLQQAGNATLIATCAELSPALQSRDVFPLRAAGNTKTIWLDKSLPGTLNLSWGEGASRSDGTQRFALGVAKGDQVGQAADFVRRYAGKETLKSLEAIDSGGRLIETVGNRDLYFFDDHNHFGKVVKQLVSAGMTAAEITPESMAGMHEFFDFAHIKEGRAERVLQLQRQGLDLSAMADYMRGGPEIERTIDRRRMRSNDEARERRAVGRAARVSLVEGMIDGGATVADLAPSRLVAFAALSKTFKEQMPAIMSLEQRGLQLAKLNDFTRAPLFDRPRNVPLVKALIADGASPHYIDSLTVVRDLGDLADSVKSFTDLGYPPRPLNTMLPPELAADERLADLYPWQQVAARRAWQAAVGNERGAKNAKSDQAPTPAQAAMFWQNYEHNLAAGRSSLRADSGLSDTVALWEGAVITPQHARLLHALAFDWGRQNAESGARPEQLLADLNPGVFKNVMRELVPDFESHPERMYSDIFDSLSASEAPTSAFKVSQIFDKDWKKWIDTASQNGVSMHDATHWLPLAPKAETAGLGRYLLNNIASNREDLRVIGENWTSIEEAQRDMQPADLAKQMRLRTYNGLTSAEFALEANKWSVPPAKYAGFERAYLESLETPSPFPLEKTWRSGDLTGRFLPRTDPRGLFIGRYTDCCQYPGGAGSASAWYSQVSSKAGVFVVEDGHGTVLAESFAWVSDKGGLCFDNVEGDRLDDRQTAVGDIYQAAANDLAATFHTVTIGKGQSDLNLDRWSDASGRTLPLPDDYKGNRDSDNQVIVRYMAPAGAALQGAGQPASGR